MDLMMTSMFPGVGTHTVNISVGFRDALWSIDGFRLNGEKIKHRGFSHHHSMGGIGSAMEGVERLVSPLRSQSSTCL